MYACHVLRVCAKMCLYVHEISVYIYVSMYVRLVTVPFTALSSHLFYDTKVKWKALLFATQMSERKFLASSSSSSSSSLLALPWRRRTLIAHAAAGRLYSEHVLSVPFTHRLLFIAFLSSIFYFSVGFFVAFCTYCT